MKPMLRFSLLILLIAAGCKPNGTGAAGDVDNSADRQAFLKANIQYHLREGLAGRPITIGAIEKSDIDGLDRSSFSIGDNEYAFLVSRDDEHIVMLAAEPFQNLNSEEMAAALEQEKADEIKEAETRATLLAEAVTQVPVRGNPDAAVTIVEFSDFQCPYCRRGFDTMEELLEKRGEDIRFAYLHFPLSSHPWALPSAIASTCAAQQDDDGFWTLHDFYFEHQAEMEVGNIVVKSKEALAGSGIDLGAWETCAADPSSSAHQAAAATVNQQFELGRQFGVSGTPGFFVNGAFLNGAQPLEAFEAAIENAKAEG